ncbi:Holliday junction resolvase RecU [Mesorhizobium sp. M0016]|uniref:Holliday junction resolvase RecU n=1 Tax=Mesorhizobium sp. M0016 TaxID=2956843 RepID=UPI003338A2CA
MAKKNTGKASEQTFEEIHDTLGKRAYYCRLVDAAEVRGRTGRMGHVRPQPSDYILVVDGKTSFAEVKSTQEKTSFPFGLLRTKQSAAAKMILAAGGSYFVYLHDLTRNIWYRVPYDLIQIVKDHGKSSIPWADLKEFKWNLAIIAT